MKFPCRSRSNKTTSCADFVLKPSVILMNLRHAKSCFITYLVSRVFKRGSVYYPGTLFPLPCPRYGIKDGRQKRALVLQPWHCYKMSWKTMLRVLPPTFKPVLQQIRLLQVAKRWCKKERVVLLFAKKKFAHVARFTGLRQTCFTASDVVPVYGVTPA